MARFNGIYARNERHAMQKVFLALGFNFDYAYFATLKIGD
jgi:hypothetical protein